MDPSAIFELRQDFHLESARRLPNLPESHPCSRIHGHSFKVSLRLHGTRDAKLGWLIDYNDIKLRAHPVLSVLDHHYLNDIPGLENPTTENLTEWLYLRLKPTLPSLVQVIICETHETECRYPVL